MVKQRILTAVFAATLSLSFVTMPTLANPGNGNGNGAGHGNSGGNHGNSGKQGGWDVESKGNKGNKGNNDHNGNAGEHQVSSGGDRKNYGKPDRVESDISFTGARRLAVSHGLTGYQSLPPGIAKNLARGKPLPPGIAKRAVPASMLGQLPYYPGYEWQIVGNDLVLIALSTAVVTAIINGVFD